MNTKRIAAAGIIAAATLCVAAPAAHADTMTATRSEKTTFFAEALGKPQPTDCYTLTFSDKYKNWAALTYNPASVTSRSCEGFIGTIWFKKDLVGKWQFADAGQDDLNSAVPEKVAVEFQKASN